MPNIGVIASSISGHLFTAGTFDSIATVTVGSGGQSSISFSSIPSTYKHLQIRGITKGDAAGNGYSMIISANSDTTTANYYSHYLQGDGASASAGSYQTVGGVYVIGSTTGAGTDSSWFSPTVIDILQYGTTSKYKTFRYLTGQDRNGAGNITPGSGVWLNSSAISSLAVTISGANFVQNSQLALYGIKG
jgi:hypothetical protein